MTTFVLVHGGLHRPSCWDAVAVELVGRGHAVIVPDVPMDQEGAGAQEWAAAVVAAIDEVAGSRPRADIVVVGHSIAGLCVPVVASLRSVRQMVFVGALLPMPGMSFVEHLDTGPNAITFPAFDAGGTGPFGLTWESVFDGFYHDCSPDIARQAFDQMRGQDFTVFVERCPLTGWPDVRSTYIVMTDDRAVDGDWARSNAARVGAQLLELEGGHCPFFSRPLGLARVLIEATTPE
ncbi:alpha/beta hydrolase [Mycolicibacterium sp. 120266]|uniref:alpha/beta hydrolase n=1 Tax=Mycolicibacterium sp. 120266 TaxID=3090601 RepID=UPI00299D51E9|nr:alpha/beta hydrolase [Mycolicibacterium sp. 120266]MDX1873904.1 alpha/beta hydrolase [Mycolicibacterium sp. 120266]